jgi:hypothetical protein
VRISKRSPIRRPLLKLPGQKLDDELDDFLIDHFLAPLMLVVMLGAMCLVEWVGYLRSSPRQPWTYTCVLVCAMAAIAFHWRRQWRKAQAIKLGRNGERAVAEYLNIRLDPDSRVLHGVPIEGGEADHVLICTRGVFVIETKARTLPILGEPVVHISDAGLRVQGFKQDRDPIAQVKRYMEGLDRLMPELATYNLKTRGIVLFPSWKIVDDRKDASLVWVLEPKELEDRLPREPLRLKPNDVLHLTRKLASCVRPEETTSQR